MVNVQPIGFEPVEERDDMSKSKTAKGKAKASATKNANDKIPHTNSPPS
jgi:hypothetical protein